MRISRKKFWALLAGLPLVGSLKAKPPLPTGAEILKSFDARDWARNFELCRQANPRIIEEDCMVGWFANALMRGYDEARWQQERQTKERS